jgi:pantoate--beta-alanine ligase
VLDTLRAGLLASGFDSIDYAELRDADSLVPSTAVGSSTRLFVAARIGGTRLIDNMPLA